MRLALDTNRYADFARGDQAAVDVIQQADAVLLPFAVIGELRSGFLGGNRPIENERLLVEVMRTPRVAVLYADDQTTHVYGRLKHQLRKQGTPIPTNDIWIAALVLQHNLHLFSRDPHFDHLPQIPRI